MPKFISTYISFFILIISLAISFVIYYFYFTKSDLSINQNDKQNIINVSNKKDKIKIIAYGDSLTAGYGLLEKDSYPRQLEEKLRVNKYNVEIINAGISGETTSGALERTDFILSQDPDIALITIGGNDALRGLPQENAEENIVNIIQKLKIKINADKIFLMKIQAPANLGLKYKKDFDSMYERIAKKESVQTIDFVVDEVFLNSKYMQEDGIHPNKEGYKILVNKYIYPEITKQL